MIKLFLLISLLLINSSLGAQDFVTERYMGKWFEIARFPNRFQKHCTRDVSATYTLKKNGEINVVNQCITKKETLSRATGLAWRPDPKELYQLEVSFVPLLRHLHLFGGDYHIRALSPAYDWSIVASPKSGYLWILARHPAISDELRQELVQKVADLGYNKKDLIFTKHHANQKNEQYLENKS